MKPQPVKLELVGDDRLRIEWDDGQKREYRVRELRDRCPCATCREKRTAPQPAPGMLPVLAPEETQPLQIQGMNPVGHYAYNIRFSDGHDTGIYSLELLRQLGREVAE